MVCKREQRSKTNVYELGLRLRAKGEDTRSIVLSAGGRTEGVLECLRGHGKSPCFSRSSVLTVANIDGGGLVLAVVSMPFSLGVCGL